MASSSYMNKCIENYILVDVGANLTNRKFSRDLESVICRASESGVQKMILSSSSIKASKEALRLSRIYPGVLFATVGVHPHEAKSWTEESSNELKEIVKDEECVAIGECGLDYNKNFSPPDIQREVFRHQVQLACQLKKPLCLHERDAFDDVMTVLNEFKDDLPPIVLNSYTGSIAQAQKYLEMGVYFAISGFIAKDNSEESIQALLEGGSIQLNRVLVHSDSPFMYPNVRTSKLPEKVKTSLTPRSLSFLQKYCTFQRNEPCSLPTIVEMLAPFLGKSAEEVAVTTAFNALKIFNLC